MVDGWWTIRGRGRRRSVVLHFEGSRAVQPDGSQLRSDRKLVYVLDEYYQTPAGISRHWQEAMASWADDLGAVTEASSRATASTLHSGTVIHALW